MTIHWTDYPERVETFGVLSSIFETLDRHEMEAGFTAESFRNERGGRKAYTVDPLPAGYRFNPHLDQMPGLERLLDCFDIDGHDTLSLSQFRELRKRAVNALKSNRAAVDALTFIEVADALDAADRPPTPPTCSNSPADGINTFGDFLADVRAVEQAAAYTRAEADSMNGEAGSGYLRMQAGVLEATATYRDHPSFPSLEAYVNLHYGLFTYAYLLRARGEVCGARRCPPTEVDQLSVEQVVAILCCPGVPTGGASEPSVKAENGNPTASPAGDGSMPPSGAVAGQVPAVRVCDFRDVLRYERESRVAEQRLLATARPLRSVSDLHTRACEGALLTPQPAQLSLNQAMSFPVYRRLLRESLAVLRRELDEQALVYFVEEVAERQRQTPEKVWELSPHAFGQLLDAQPVPAGSASNEDMCARQPVGGDGVPSAPSLTDSSVTPLATQFVFAVSGDVYRISGFKESGHLPGSLKGLGVIARLLRTPGIAVPWAELDPSILAAGRRTEQPTYDARGMTELRENRRRLQEEIDTAENEVEKADSQRQLDELNAHLRLVVGLRGNPRDLNNPLDKLRPKIWGQIKKVYEKLREAAPRMPLLATHFKSCITSSADGFVYNSPAPAPFWQTEANPK